MFTGIIEETGQLTRRVVRRDEAALLHIAATAVVVDATPGDSIAVNGVCLTVVDRTDGGFTADVMAESLRRTTLGDLDVGDSVNLERAVTAGTRLGGHIVQGHVDGVAVVTSVERSEHWTTVTVELPPGLEGFLAEKGSITVDGVSLTVSGVSRPAPPHQGVGDAEHDHPHWFRVSLIPTTQDVTTLSDVRVGRRVNLEVDVIAKYVDRLLSVRQP